jgi:proline iminopeptidase
LDAAERTSQHEAKDRPAFALASLMALPGGHQVEWEAVGEGPPLLWIEGGPGLPAHLARPDVALFADRFRCHLVNAPGCGRSTPPASTDGYSLEAHVRYFDEVRRALGLGPVTLMGHSWGGLVALALAIEVPEAVERIVVLDGYAGEASVSEDAAAAERDQALDRVRDAPWFEDAVTRFAVDDANETARELDGRFAACWPLYFAAPASDRSRPHIERLARETRWNIDVVRAWAPEPQIDLRPSLARLDIPVLVVVGEHDFICGPVWARAIADAAPRATYHEVADAGHMPQYEAPTEVRRVVLDWLEATG